MNNTIIQLWEQLHDLFDTNDGSLPDIELNSLTADQVENIYLYLRLNSKLISHSSYFWSFITDEEILVDSVENAASLVVNDEAECFHIVIGGLCFGGKSIPDLGVFISRDSICLDYRMGQEWGSTELGALFILFSRIREIAPLVEIEYLSSYSKIREQFKSALTKYWDMV